MSAASILLLLFHCVYFAFSIPLGASKLAMQDLIPSHFSNASYPLRANTSFVSRPAFLPHKFKVPNTSTTIYLGFGILYKSLDPISLGILLAVTEGFIAQQIENQGAATAFPIHGLGTQYFHKSLGDGVQMEVWNLDVQSHFTWGMLKNVIDGLQLYLVEERRYRQCWFEFHNGPGGTIGGGRIVPDTDDGRSNF